MIVTTRRAVLSHGGGGNGLLRGLVGYFALDEASGDTVDEVGPYTVGAVNGPTSETGKVYALARQLTFADAEYFFQNTVGVFDIAGSMGLAAWVYPDAFSGVAGQYRHIAQTRTSYIAGGWKLLGAHDGQLVVTLNDSGGPATMIQWHPGLIMTTGAWQFIAFTYNVTTGLIEAWRNTTRVSTTWSTGTLKKYGSNDFWIGCTQTAGHTWDGRLQSLCVWDRVLTAADIALLYNGGSGLPYESFAT